MRLRLLTVASALALALAAPSAALAHNGRGHHRHHHNAKAHHARFRFEHIGPTGVSGPTGTPTAPTTPPSGPTTPENAGEVKSYSSSTGMLELTLNGGSTVTGKVTSNTRIECVSATPTSSPPSPTDDEEGDKSPGDDSGEGDDQSRGDMSQSGEGFGDHRGDGGDDDDGEAHAGEPPCDTSLLTEGRKVRAAELRIGPAGTEFESLILVR
jgi:hypothetical protein